MTAKVVKDVLSLDLTSIRTAAQVRTLVPGRWASDPEVPLFLYTSLRDIFDPSLTNQQFKDLIIESYGVGATPADMGIHLITLPAESVTKDYGMQLDKVGVEIALLSIMVQLGENLLDAQIDIVEQADLRIRWLLDYNIRSTRRKKGDLTVVPGLSSNADMTIYPNAKDTPVICNYEAFLNNESSIAKASLYRLQYFRIFV